MRYRITANVEGDVYLSNPCRIYCNNFLYEFFVNDRQKVEKISISKHVPEEMMESLGMTVSSGKGDIKFNFEFKTDDMLHEEIQKKLQEIEAHLGFATIGTLRKVLWEIPTIEYVPEDDSDEEKIKSSSVSLKRRLIDKPIAITDEYLIKIIKNVEELELLSISKSFWLLGSNLYRISQYILAFYQFYFVIEGLYANGKFRTNEVLKEFQKSKKFTEVCEYAMKFFSTNCAEMNEKINQFLSQEELECSVIGMQTLILRMRGNLHHYSHKCKKDQPIPTNQEKYKEIASMITVSYTHLRAHETRG